MVPHKEVVLFEPTEQGTLNSMHRVKLHTLQNLNCTQKEKLKEEYVCQTEKENC